MHMHMATHRERHRDRHTTKLTASAATKSTYPNPLAAPE